MLFLSGYIMKDYKMKKIRVIYDSWDPTQSDVGYIAIETELTPPCVFKTYGNVKDIPDRLPSDMAVVSKNLADIFFEFQKGNIAELCK